MGFLEHRIVQSVIPCLIGAITFVVNPAAVLAEGDNSEALSSRIYIGSMPPDTASVMVWRFRELFAEPSYLCGEAVQKQGDNASKQATQAINRRGPLEIMWKMVGRTDPLIMVNGISHSTGSEYETQSIVVTRQSITAVKDSLADGLNVEGEVTPIPMDGTTVYKVTSPTESSNGAEDDKPTVTSFIAFPDDHTVVVTEDIDDIQHMIRSLNEQNGEIPDQWKSLSDPVDLSSPLVILRRYEKEAERELFSPINPNRPEEGRIDIYGYAVTLPNVQKPQLHIYCRTTEVDRASQLLAFLVKIKRKRWDIKELDEGFEANIPLHAYENPEELLIYTGAMFGVFMPPGEPK